MTNDNMHLVNVTFSVGVLHLFCVIIASRSAFESYHCSPDAYSHKCSCAHSSPAESPNPVIPMAAGKPISGAGRLSTHIWRTGTISLAFSPSLETNL